MYMSTFEFVLPFLLAFTV